MVEFIKPDRPKVTAKGLAEALASMYKRKFMFSILDESVICWPIATANHQACWVLIIGPELVDNWEGGGLLKLLDEAQPPS